MAFIVVKGVHNTALKLLLLPVVISKYRMTGSSVLLVLLLLLFLG